MISFLSLPNEPGVYQFKDKENNIIYVGKAINLRKRVSSYFKSGSNNSPRTQLLMKNIADVECIIVQNEVEALLLENKLIKKYSPKYNINLKDSKTYAYIAISCDDYPRIFSSRKALFKGNYFGPFVQASARRNLIDLTVQLFKLRVCRNLPTKACLNYHIGLCSAPCIGKVSLEEYQYQVKSALDFLQGDTKAILKKLMLQMEEHSQKREYEKALILRKQIDAIEHLREKQHVDLVKKFDQDVIALSVNHNKALVELFSISKGVISGKKEFSFDYEEDVLLQFIKLYYSQNYIPPEIIVGCSFWESDAEHLGLEAYLSQLKGVRVHLIYPQRGEKADLVRMVQKNAEYSSTNPVLQDMKEKLLLPVLPVTIECFDISNLGYDHIVGGMTQWISGKPNKSGYRKFEVRSNEGQDDFAAMKEVVLRRYSRLRDEGKRFPDLIIIDGGAAHLACALESLEKIGVKIPTIALAKQREEIYLSGKNVPILFGAHTPMMLYLRQIRDSAHNFVLSYNRKKRQMGFREETKDQ
jgi:excinuclease ABC subunit C